MITLGINGKLLQKELTGHGGVSFGSTELLLSHVLIGDRLHNIRSCDEQVRCVLLNTNMHSCQAGVRQNTI